MPPPCNSDPPQRDDNDHDINFRYQSDKRLLKLSFRRRDAKPLYELAAFCLEHKKPIGGALFAAFAFAGINLPSLDHRDPEPSPPVIAWPDRSQGPYDNPITGGVVPHVDIPQTRTTTAKVSPKRTVASKKVEEATEDTKSPPNIFTSIANYFWKCLTTPANVSTG
jgi:hypothetical protein